MDEIEQKIGQELYAKVLKKLGSGKIIFDNGKLIPKHRFDCVNLSLKDNKEQNTKLMNQIKVLNEQIQRMNEVEKQIDTMEREVIILTELLNYKVKNYKTIIPLLNLHENSTLELKTSLGKQIRNLKKTDPYLFSDSNELYKLVPYTKNKKSE